MVWGGAVDSQGPAEEEGKLNVEGAGIRGGPIDG